MFNKLYQLCNVRNTFIRLQFPDQFIYLAIVIQILIFLVRAMYINETKYFTEIFAQNTLFEVMNNMDDF